MANHSHTDHSIFEEAVHSEARRRGVSPFICRADDTLTAATGIEVVAGLLRRDALERLLESDSPTMSERDIDGLLGLIQFAAAAINEDVCNLAEWSAKHFVKGAKP